MTITSMGVRMPGSSRAALRFPPRRRTGRSLRRASSSSQNGQVRYVSEYFSPQTGQRFIAIRVLLPDSPRAGGAVRGPMYSLDIIPGFHSAVNTAGRNLCHSVFLCRGPLLLTRRKPIIFLKIETAVPLEAARRRVNVKERDALDTILIGVAGGTGSGKTTLTHHLKEHFGEDVTVIGHDSYYKRQEGKTYEERAKQNYDHPSAFDTDLLIEHLQALKRGESIQCPVYSYTDHNRTDQTVTVHPAKVIIVEGILIFQNPVLRDMFDIKLFVETDADERILRRALRDVEERGRTLQSVVTQYLTTVKPMHDQYVEPSRKYADIIVLEGGHNLVALEMIMQRIQNHIDGSRS